MPRPSGFTEAELAAYEWSRSRKRRKSSQNRRSSGSRRRSPSDASASDSDSSVDDRDTRRGHRRHQVHHHGHRRSRNHRSRHQDSRTDVRSLSKSSRSRSHSHSRSRRRYRSTSSSTPRDPYNPLKLAHRNDHYGMSSHHNVHSNHPSRWSPGHHNDHSIETGTHSKKEERWKHDLYESDSERAAYEAELRAQRQNTGYIVDTRRGSWRSRAGGVYLSPKENVQEEDLYEDYRERYRSSPSYGM